MLEITRADRALDRARAHEEERFEGRMVGDVEQRGRERERDHRAGIERAGDERRPDAHEDDADVLHAVVREQAFQVVLHQRVEHPQHRRSRAENQDERAPPGWSGREPVECQTQESVDPELDHHARHERGNVRRRDGVGARQPDVEGDHPRLRAEADQAEREDDGGGARIDRGRVGGPVAELQRRARAGKEEERGDDARGRGVGHDEICPGCSADRVVAVLGEHEREGGERHRLPCEEEGEGIAGDGHREHRENEEHVDQAAAAKGGVVTGVARRVEAGHRADRHDDEREERTQAVELPAQNHAGQGTGERHQGRTVPARFLGDVADAERRRGQVRCGRRQAPRRRADSSLPGDQ